MTQPGEVQPIGDGIRPMVVDLAFGTPLAHDPEHGLRRVDRDVRPLLESVDQMSVVVDGRREHLRQVWRRVFAGLDLPAGRPLVVGHPSTWGPRRASTLADLGDGRAPVASYRGRCSSRAVTPTSPCGGASSSRPHISRGRPPIPATRDRRGGTCRSSDAVRTAG